MAADRRSPRPALLIALLAFVMLGLADGVLGTVWPDLRDNFDRTNASFGLIFTSWSGGYLVASAASGHISDRHGIGSTLSAGTAIAVVGLVAVATAPLWGMVLTGFVVLGLGNGLTDATANAWVAITAGAREMGALHTAYGFGASGGPLLATAFVANQASWRLPFMVLIVMQVGVAAMVSRCRSGYQTSPPTVERGNGSSNHRSKLVAVVLLIWFGLYVGVEVSIGQWSYTVLTEGRGVGEVAAGVLAASFWIGITVGRMGLAAVGHRLDPERGMNHASLGSIIAATILWLDPGGLGGLALPFLGLCFSVMFPLVVLVTPRYLDGLRAQRQVGYQLASASLGAIVIPASIGILADDHGVDIAVPVSVAIVIAMTALWATLRREAGVSRAVS